jgi:hypothetical protein
VEGGGAGRGRGRAVVAHAQLQLPGQRIGHVIPTHTYTALGSAARQLRCHTKWSHEAVNPTPNARRTRAGCVP